MENFCRVSWRSFLLVSLLAALVLLACRLPATITRELAQRSPAPTYTSTPTQSLSPTAYTIPETSYPAPGEETAYPLTGLETPYPDSGVMPYPGAGGSNPYPGLPTAYPGPSPYPVDTTLASEIASPTFSPTQTAMPPGVGASTSYPPSGPGGYPPPYPPPFQPGDVPYPGAGVNPPLGPYPGPGAVPTWTPTPFGGFQPLPSSTTSLAPTQPVVTSPTATLFPTPTLFQTPTPTTTSTPTRTPTPLPPPPWVNARLHSTDPSTVRLASGEVQLVEFFAFWSGPSQAMAPIIQALEGEYQDRIIFTYLDIDDPATQIFQRQLAFRTEPHFFLLDPQGHILRQWTGYVTPDQFRQAFQSALNP